MNRFDYPYFHLKAPDFLIELCKKQGQKKGYKKGENILRFDEYPHNLYLVESGICGLTEFSRKGMNKSLGLIMPGGTFGEVPIMMDDCNRADVDVIKDCDLFVLHKNILVNHIKEHHADNLVLIKYLAHKINFIEYVRSLLTEYNAIQRMAIFFRSYIEYNKLEAHDGFYNCHLDFTHEQLAQILYSSRVSITLLLNYLDDLNMVKHHGAIYAVAEGFVNANHITDMQNISWKEIRKSEG